MIYLRRFLSAGKTQEKHARIFEKIRNLISAKLRKQGKNVGTKNPDPDFLSSQSRYDRFDTFPYSAKAWKNTLCAYYFIGFERKSQAFFGKKVDIYRAKRLQ